MRVLVCGGRDFDDYELVCRTLDRIDAMRSVVGITCIIHGGARGADALADRSEAAKRRYLLYGFRTVATEMQLGRFKMCHMPYVGDSRHIERYQEWRPKDAGGWLLHGHVHEVWRMRGRMINVGVDVNQFRPVGLAELEKLADGVENLEHAQKKILETYAETFRKLAE